MNDTTHFLAYLDLESLEREELRYGQNPHQKGFLFREKNPPPGNIVAAEMIQGKPLSFNNIADASAAIECVFGFSDPTCVIVKHENPCGVALGATLSEAYNRAHACDLTSAFGGVIAFNERFGEDTAGAILDRQFVEVIMAPEVLPGARAVLARKPDVRVLVTGYPAVGFRQRWDIKSIPGGFLIQERDVAVISVERLEFVTKRGPTERELDDLLFAWRVAKYVKSNAIVYAREGQTIGIGAGQMNRAMSVDLAGRQALAHGFTTSGAVMASDAFFPFRDGVDAAAGHHIAAIIQPGGSKKDKEVIAAADEHGMAMVLTGIRHFRH